MLRYRVSRAVNGSRIESAEGGEFVEDRVESLQAQKSRLDMDGRHVLQGCARTVKEMGNGAQSPVGTVKALFGGREVADGQCVQTTGGIPHQRIPAVARDLG